MGAFFELDICLQLCRPHCLIDMRVVDDQGKALPHDGKTVGNLQVRGEGGREGMEAAGEKEA